MTLPRTNTRRQRSRGVSPERAPDPPTGKETDSSGGDGAHERHRPAPTGEHRQTAPGDGNAAGSSVAEIMHARLEAMAKPREDDSPRLARLRAVLRDQKIMSKVVANVDSWPELTEEQWAEAIALLRPRRDF